jgi:hypothetical protein
MFDLGGLVVRFKEDERFKGVVREVVEWLGVFLIMVVVLWIIK